MKRIKSALATIQEDGTRAEEVLEQGLNADRRGFVAGLALWMVQALNGVVVNPDDL